MSAQRSRAGFTLIELMIVVTIIGISILAFAPSFTRAMAEREVSFATRELLRIAKRGRVESSVYRRAYLMYVDPTDDAEPIIRLLRGTNNSCVAQAWVLHEATCGTPNSQCVEDVDVGDNVAYTTSGYTTRLFEMNALNAPVTATRAICWAPNGTMYTKSPADLATPFTEAHALNTVNGGVLYRLRLHRDDTAVGRPHNVLIPIGGGSPMVVR